MLAPAVANLPSLLQTLQGRLIVSCQAPDGDAFRDSGSMARFARAAEAGGAAGIRADSPEDIRAIKSVVRLPVIGIQKRIQADGKVLITPSFEDARVLVDAGADIVAIDCTQRGQQYGAIDRLKRIRAELRVPVMADIATKEEALAAAASGADLVASTMRGYTDETKSIKSFDLSFVAELARRLSVPVLAEGRVETPEQAAEAIRAGAFAVIVGTAITRPEAIAARFVRAIERVHLAASKPRNILGIDLGGTNTKTAIVSRDGKLHLPSSVPTDVRDKNLLDHLKSVVSRMLEDANRRSIPVDAIGVATAGWIDPHAGRVVYATENLPGWTGTSIAEELRRMTGLPVAIENDANAATVAERHFGAARGVDNFVCLTLGTGIGGGAYVGGRLMRGAHHLANAIGHIPIQMDGPPCNCGLNGCLEIYANAAALVRYAGNGFHTAKEVIQAANAGSPEGVSAIRQYAGYLAAGIRSTTHLLDPSMVVLTGGIAQNNHLLVSHLEEQPAGTLLAASHRQLRIRFSSLGFYSGVMGAAAAATEMLEFIPQ